MIRLLKTLFLIIFLLTISFFTFAQKTNITLPFEENTNSTPTYHEVIKLYEKMATNYPELQLKEWGKTDAGYPLHTAVLSLDGNFDPEKTGNKQVLFINNAIHPGESCGVDATLLLYRNILQNKQLYKKLKNTILVAIPIYNIGGALNRNSHTRTNQNGPEAYGFRGNAKNLDLNRDFIKCDSENAKSFSQIFTYWQPDVFVDNHTSNGADYQYTMTLIAAQKDKLDPYLSDYLQKEMLPELYKSMEDKNWEMIPYVFARDIPDNGIAAFLDLPRYSSGYAALHNCISFTAEAHMLKPYKDRVLSTYALMESLIETMHKDAKKIKEARKKAKYHTQTKESFAINWQLDANTVDSVSFKGYEAKYKPSEVHNGKRLWYDRNAPYQKNIAYFNTYKTTENVQKPYAYIIPQAYTKVIERLKLNGVQLKRLIQNTMVNGEFYYIDDFKTRNAYEAHYLHSNVKVRKKNMEWTYNKGDYVVFVDQSTNRYIIETLEPQAPDSFFAWNFFDGILQQKEYFSTYVFEDLAAEYLTKDSDLKERLRTKQSTDSTFSGSAWKQLEYVYKHTPHYEKTHRLYPVIRVLDRVALPVE